MFNVSTLYRQSIKSLLLCYSVLSTIAQVLRKMSLKFSILIFDALIITDLWITPEG